MSVVNHGYFSKFNNTTNSTRVYFSYWIDLSSSTGQPSLIELSILLTVLIIAVVNNMLFVLLLCTHKKLRVKTNIIASNMSFSVLLYIPLTWTVSSGLLHQEWVSGEIACKYSIFAIIFTSLVLICDMGLISVDRYRHIILPRKKQLSSLTITVIMILLWCLGLVTCIPFASIPSLHKVYNPQTCSVITVCARSSSVIGLVLTIATVVIVSVPIILSSLCYRRIMTQLQEVTIRLRKCTVHTISTANVTDPVKLDNVNRQKYARVIRMLVVMMIAFVLMWTPPIMLLVAVQADALLETFGLQNHYTIAGLTFVLLNYSITPVIFCASDTQIQKHLKLNCR